MSRDAEVNAGNGAQDVPAPPHPVVDSVVPAPALLGDDVPVAERVPVPELPGSDMAMSRQPETTTVPSPGPAAAQPLPQTPGLDIRVVASRQGPVSADSRAVQRTTSDVVSRPAVAPVARGAEQPVSSDVPAEAATAEAPIANVTPVTVSRPAPQAALRATDTDVPAPPAPRAQGRADARTISPRLEPVVPDEGVPAAPMAPATAPALAKATVAADPAVPGRGDTNASARPLAAKTPQAQAPSLAGSAAASVRTAANAERNAAHGNSQDHNASGRGGDATAQQGVAVPELSAAGEPAATPASAGMPARTVTTVATTPAPVRTDVTTAAADIDARFEPMRRAADQVTLQFQGEGGLEGRLRIVVRGDAVHASILSSHDGTLERLGSEAGTLRRALSEQGFSQARISVHDLRAGGATSTSESRQNAREGDDRRQGEPQRRSGQGRESRQGSDSAKDRRASRDERRSK